MNCEQFLESLDLLLDAEAGRGPSPLSADDLSELREHRGACASCRGELGSARELAAAFQDPRGLAPVAEVRLSYERRRSGRWRTVATLASGCAAAWLVLFALFRGGRNVEAPSLVGVSSRAGSITIPESLDRAARDAAAAGSDADALAATETLLDSFPQHALAAAAHVRKARLLFRLHRPADALGSMEIVLAEAAPKAPPIGAMKRLWDAFHLRGDLSGLEEAAAVAKDYYAAVRSEGQLAGDDLRRLDEEVDVSEFRESYTAFVLGEFGRAREGFEAQVRSFEGRAAAGTLSPVLQIYLKRARDNALFLSGLAGRPVPGDLDLAEGWATERRVRLAGAPGTVVAIVFRSAGDARSAEFLARLSQLAADDPRLVKLEIVTVSFLGSRDVLASRKAELIRELQSMGYKGAAGFDPDAKVEKTFRAFQATIGSATLEVVDPRGNLVWFLQDPRGIDGALVREVLLRAAQR